MDRSYDGITFILRLVRVASFADIIKIATMFININFEDQKTKAFNHEKLKGLENMH